MSKRKTSMAGGSRAKAAAKARPAPTEDRATEDQASEDQISYSALSLHEEQKQNILIAMNCPCCGAGAMSYTVKLKR
jgi:hypothetical protein